MVNDMCKLSANPIGANIALGAASASATIPNMLSGQKPRVFRISSNNGAYVRWGKGAQTAAAGDFLLPANYSEVIIANGADTIAALQLGAGGVLNVIALED